MSDEEVVEIVRSQNQELYAEIIHRYQAKLTRYLRYFVHDKDDIDEVLQLVFIKTFRNLNAFDIEKKFSSWIYRITHNEAINFIKKRHNFNIDLDVVAYKIIDEKFDIKKDMDNEFLRDKIEKAFSELKMKYSEPLILFYFQDKSYEEISDILKIPTSTVGVLINRGKKQLREQLTFDN